MIIPESPDAIEKGAAALRAGALVAMPTETVYGLAADATNDRAVASIYEAKGRPSFNPLIAHVGSFEMAAREAIFSPLAERLARLFWPGPLTLVLPRRAEASASLLVSAGLDTLALRAPAHKTARALIQALARPLAAPSANRSGAVSPTRAAHVEESLGDRVSLIIDAGPTPVGLESTILKIDGERATLLRPGGLAVADLEKKAGVLIERPAASRIEAPGMMESHYAPDAPVLLEVAAPRAGWFHLSFGAAPAGSDTLNLSPSGDLVEAAANLFAYLREADAACRTRGLRGVSVAPIPSHGLGEAINDRLRRAAAPR